MQSHHGFCTCVTRTSLKKACCAHSGSPPHCNKWYIPIMYTYVILHVRMSMLCTSTCTHAHERTVRAYWEDHSTAYNYTVTTAVSLSQLYYMLKCGLCSQNSPNIVLIMVVDGPWSMTLNENIIVIHIPIDKKYVLRLGICMTYKGRASAP